MNFTPVEGYFLRFGGCVWAVKGCHHPEGYAIAVPRKCGDVKVKKLSDAMELVRRKFPQLLSFDPVVNRVVPLVPLKDAEVLDPFEAEVRDRTAREFIDLLGGKVGVTGSLLYDDRHNDLDFLSFDEHHYVKLRELREGGITSPLESHEESEVEGLREECFAEFKKSRVLEGVFKGIPYTFKIVKCVEEGEVVEERRIEGEFVIINAVKPFSIPVMYEAVGETRVVLKSYRTRFTELKEGLRLSLRAPAQLRKDQNTWEVNLDWGEVIGCT